LGKKTGKSMTFGESIKKVSSEKQVRGGFPANPYMYCVSLEDGKNDTTKGIV
jgi:hypothetical protein